MNLQFGFTICIMESECQRSRLSRGENSLGGTMLPLETQQSTQVAEHRGPSLGVVALVHVGLFVASLVVLGVMKKGAFPLPYASVEAAQTFYAQNTEAVRISAFLQFGAAIPLGIFTAAITSRLRFLGLNVAGVSIALFGGLAASVMLALCGLMGWVLSQPGVANETGAMRALQLLGFTTGGVGSVVPFGLLLAGVSASGGLSGLLPRWIMVWGLVVALLAELATLSLVVPQVSILLPLGRFPGLLWMVAAGFALPKSRSAEGERV